MPLICKIMFIFGVLLIYFFPCIVRSLRDSTNGFVVFLINLLTGWSVIGWLAALLIACVSQTKTSAAIERETLRRLRQGQ